MFASEIIVWDSHRQPAPDRYSVSIKTGPEVISRFPETMLEGSPPIGWHDPVNFKDSFFSFLTKSWMHETFPDLASQMESVQKRVQSGYRFCLVDGLPFHEMEAGPVRDYLIYATTSLLGYPSPADYSESGRVLWPVKLGDDLPKTKIQTFTQTDREAETHTDSAFRERPEQFFALWSIHADEHGGGVSGLVDMRAIISSLSEQDRICLRQPYPIRIPTVFSENMDDASVEILHAPLLIDTDDEFTVRCSFPNINLALQAGEAICNSQKMALERFKEACTRDEFQLNFVIPSGSMLVVNNHELGHSRTAVLDPDRHLIRVRYNAGTVDEFKDLGFSLAPDLRLEV